MMRKSKVGGRLSFDDISKSSHDHFLLPTPPGASPAALVPTNLVREVSKVPARIVRMSSGKEKASKEALPWEPKTHEKWRF